MWLSAYFKSKNIRMRLKLFIKILAMGTATKLGETKITRQNIKGAVSRQSSSFCLILPVTRPQSQWNLK